MLVQPYIDSESAMAKPPPLEPLPPMRHLRIFESAARLGSFSGAAEELHTTQSAVSRAVAELERRLGARLFDRVHRGVRLTRSGELYREAVAPSLDRIGAAGAALAWSETAHVVIACTHAVSAMFLMPLRAALYEALGGGDTHFHILTCDSDLLGRVGPGEADMVLSHDPGDSAPEDRAVAFRDAVTPVCAPAYAEDHADILRGPVEGWTPLTFLHHARPSRGWATWDDWFEAAGRPRGRVRRLSYYDHLFQVEDAIDGQGLALGWRRLIDRHLESGALTAVRDRFVEFDRFCHARLTERGRRRPPARRCLEFLADLSRRTDGL